jgi:hypothetical protein
MVIISPLRDRDSEVACTASGAVSERIEAIILWSETVATLSGKPRAYRAPDELDQGRSTTSLTSLGRDASIGAWRRAVNLGVHRPVACILGGAGGSVDRVGVYPQRYRQLVELGQPDEGNGALRW